MFIVRTEHELNQIILVAIMRQQTEFFSDTIVTEVCRDILPLNAQEAGYYTFPANQMYQISPNRDFIEMAVKGEITQLLAEGKITANNINGVISYCRS